MSGISGYLWDDDDDIYYGEVSVCNEKSSLLVRFVRLSAVYCILNPPVSDENVSVTKNDHFPIRAERGRCEVRHQEHPKMYPPNCIFAPRSCWALLPIGQLWPSLEKK